MPANAPMPRQGSCPVDADVDHGVVKVDDALIVHDQRKRTAIPGGRGFMREELTRSEAWRVITRAIATVRRLRQVRVVVIRPLTLGADDTADADEGSVEIVRSQTAGCHSRS